MKPSEETKQGLRKKLDTAHGELVRSRGRCVTCGSKQNITCGHLIHRAKWATRWDTEPNGNCHPQCWHCNCHHEENPDVFTAWYKTKFGEGQYDMLFRRSNLNYSPSKQEMINKLIEIKKEKK